MDKLCLPEPLAGPIPGRGEKVFGAALGFLDLLEEKAALSAF